MAPVTEESLSECGGGSMRHQQRRKSQQTDPPTLNENSKELQGQRKIFINPPASQRCKTFASNKLLTLSHIWYYAYFLMLWGQAFRLPYTLSLVSVLLAAAIPSGPAEVDHIKKTCCNITWPANSGLVDANGVMSRLLPLWLAMSVSAGLQYLSLRRRGQIVNTLNRRVYHCIDHVEGRAVAITRAEVCVGQILRLRKNDEVPADCLLLSTSNSDGTMRIETYSGTPYSMQKTMNNRVNQITGASNMRRVAIRETRTEITGHAIRNMRGEIRCANIQENRDFKGVLRLKDHPRGAAIDPRALIRTGDIVRGCEWCYAIVAFSGVSQDILRNRPGEQVNYHQWHKSHFVEFKINRRVGIVVCVSLLASFICMIIQSRAGNFDNSIILPLAASEWTSKINKFSWRYFIFYLVIALDGTGLASALLMDITQFVCTRSTERELKARCLAELCDEGDRDAQRKPPTTRLSCEFGTDDPADAADSVPTDPNKVVPSRIATSKLDVLPAASCVDVVLADQSAMLTQRAPYVFEACAISGVVYGWSQTAKRGQRKGRARRSVMGSRSPDGVTRSSIGDTKDLVLSARTPRGTSSSKLLDNHSINQPPLHLVQTGLQGAVYDSSSGFSLSTDNDQSTTGLGNNDEGPLSTRGASPRLASDLDARYSLATVENPYRTEFAQGTSAIRNGASSARAVYSADRDHIHCGPRLNTFGSWTHRTHPTGLRLQIEGTGLETQHERRSNSGPIETFSDLSIINSSNSDSPDGKRETWRERCRAVQTPPIRDEPVLENPLPSELNTENRFRFSRATREASFSLPRNALPQDEANKRTAHFLPISLPELVSFADTSILRDLRAGGRKSYDIDLFLKALCVCNTLSVERQMWKPTLPNGHSKFTETATQCFDGNTLVRDAFLQAPQYSSGRACELPAILGAQKMGYQLFAKCKRWIAMNINGEFKRLERIYKSDAFLGGQSTIVVLKNENRKGGIMFFKCYLQGLLHCIATYSKATHTRLQYMDHEMNAIANKMLGRGQIPVCVAYRHLQEREIRVLSRRMIALSNVVNETKAELIDCINAELISGCHWLGMVAYREILQPRVPQTLAAFREAAIRVWLISSGFEEGVFALACASRVVTPTTRIFRITADTKRSLLAQHRDVARIAANNPKGSQLALVLSGDQLDKIMTADEECLESLEMILVSMFWRANVVLMHSMTAVQKGLLTKMVRKHLKPTPIILAVGSGLNDVPMLQQSTVGVAVSAAVAQSAEDLYLRDQPYEGVFDARVYSDMIIPRFEYLIELMFHQGARAHTFCFVTVRLCYVHGLHEIFSGVYCLLAHGSYKIRIAERLIQLLVCVEPFIMALWPQDLNKACHSSLPILYILRRRSGYLQLSVILQDTVYALLCTFITLATAQVCVSGSASTTPRGSPRDGIVDVIFIRESLNLMSTTAYGLFIVSSVITNRVRSWCVLFLFLVFDVIFVGVLTSTVSYLNEHDSEREPFGAWFDNRNTLGSIISLGALFCLIGFTCQIADISSIYSLKGFLIQAATQYYHAPQFRRSGRESMPSRAGSNDSIQITQLRNLLNPLKAPRLLAAMPKPTSFTIHFVPINGTSTKITLPEVHPIDIASVKLYQAAKNQSHELLSPGSTSNSPSFYTFTPYNLRQIRVGLRRNERREPWLLVEPSMYDDFVRSSRGNSNQHANSTSRFDPMPLARKRSDHFVPGSTTAGVNNDQIGTVFDRRRLRFKDLQLEADYQSHRIEHIRRYRISCRLIFLAHSVICIANVIDEMFFIKGNLGTSGAVMTFLPYIVSVCLSAACYNETAFVSNYDRLAGTFVIGLLIAQLLSDTFNSKDGSSVAAVYMVIFFIFFRLPFTHSLVYNCVHFVTYCLRFTLTSELIEAGAVASTNMNTSAGSAQRNSFQLTSSMENITVPKLITYLPVLLGIEVFTGFAAYRLEYNRRKAYLLQYQIDKARKRQIEILNNMLPPFVVKEMIKGKLNANGIPIGLKAEDRGTVSVMFLDVHDFQNIVSQMAPTHLVRILDSLFLCFDKCAEKYGCVKIETVFETFLAASGIHLDEAKALENAGRNIEDYALAALCMCILALQSCRHITYVPDADTRRSKRLHVRIGIHAGRVISGVVGAKKPQYALFGDTVNTASRMMSNGPADHIHVSDAFYKLIQGSEWELEWTAREIVVKGKGLMKTHQLNRTNIPDHFLETTAARINTRSRAAAAAYQTYPPQRVGKRAVGVGVGGVSVGVGVGVGGVGSNGNTTTSLRLATTLHTSDSEDSDSNKAPCATSNLRARPTARSRSIRCFRRVISNRTSAEETDNHELLFYQSIHLISLKFKSTKLEKAYVSHYYTNDNNINSVEQALIIFLATYIAQTLVFLYVPRYDTDSSNSQRSITWATRIILTGLILILWLVIHQRRTFLKSFEAGIKWVIFMTNLVSLVAGSAVLLESAWTLDFPEGVSPVWLQLDTLQIFFFTTILHQNSALLVQHLLLIDAFVNLLCLSFISTICQRGNVTAEAVFIIPIFTLSNLVSVYFREYVDRHTFVVNELMKSAEARALQLLKDNMPRQVFEEISSLRLAYLHSKVTFIFADICGFTTWADTVDAGEVVTVLQSLFAKFDRDSSRFGVFKVCTIGDAYVAISEPSIDQTDEERSSITNDQQVRERSSPPPQVDPAEGAARILALGLCMIKDIVCVREKLNIPTLDMRIGLHHGQCVGGVIGSGRLRYDIWGLDVLAGNLMESNGVPGRLCASQELVDFLEITFPGHWQFSFHKRVQIAPNCFTNAFLLVDPHQLNISPKIAAAPAEVNRALKTSVVGSIPIDQEYLI